VATSRKLLVVLVLAAFVAFLMWTTLSAQKVECEICVTYGGGRNCATATAADEAAAARAAQTTACGPLAEGMSASEECGNTPPVRRLCHSK